MTQLADVDMNRASMTPKDVPVDAAGTISSSVPMAINTANPRIDTRAGERKNREDRRAIRPLVSVAIMNQWYEFSSDLAITDVRPEPDHCPVCSSLSCLSLRHRAARLIPNISAVLDLLPPQALRTSTM